MGPIPGKERRVKEKKTVPERLPSMETWKACLYLTGKVRGGNAAETLHLDLDIESIITLFILQYLKHPSQVKVVLIEKDDTEFPFKGVSVERKVISSTLRPSEPRPPESSLAKLPAIVLVNDDGATTVISGLCSVCRTIVQLSGQEGILGFKRSCLAAPTEASVWTKFCEIDALRFVDRLMMAERREQVLELDTELARFEMHLKQPVRIHNFAKVIKDMEKMDMKSSLERDQNEAVVIKHQFVEGPTMFLADLVLLPVFYFLFQRLQREEIRGFLPLTLKWFETMEKESDVEILERMTQEMDISVLAIADSLQLPSVEYVSLYKSDPKRYKPRKRIFTRQQDIDSALEKIARIPVDMRNHNPETPGKRLQIDWEAAFGMPEEGDLPKSRLDRKQDQLKSLAEEVVHLANPGDVIVDFCSGSGHLGLLVASLLPQCQIVLLENKAESLDRAKVRAKAVNLRNVIFLQSNLDYFTGAFNIGLSLHACGVATDIVMSLCVAAKAHFISCPCCYGGILDMPHISFPRSEFFRRPINVGRDADEEEEEVKLTPGDYFCIAHGADQSHAEDVENTLKEKSDQGQFCMDIVDYDRRRYAEEQGYEVIATKLQPVNCTQKNRLLIGQFLKMDK